MGVRRSPPTVLIVADDELRAAGLEALLKSTPGLRVAVVGLAELAHLADDDDPVVVLSLSPPRVARTLQTLEELSRIPAVIILAAEPHAAWTAQARRAGVRAVLGSDPTADELSAAIAATRAGLVALHPDALSRAAATRSISPSARDALTPREVEILEMMAEGMGNRRIAASLRISRFTVKFHVASILAKLGAATRTEAVTLGVRRGIIAL
jgi:DNA-binding NarL/FixJ family response regulator